MTDKAKEDKRPDPAIEQRKALVQQTVLIEQWMTQHKARVEDALSGTDLTATSLKGRVVDCVRRNPMLAQCDIRSLYGAAIESGKLGLEPDDGRGLAYLIPRRIKGVLKAQFQIGYKGGVQLAYNTGLVANIRTMLVYEHDQFQYQYGLHEELHHVPAKWNERGEPTHVYAIVYWIDANRPPLWGVMDLDEVIHIRDTYSDGYQKFAKKKAELEAKNQSTHWLSSPWDGNDPITFAWMAKKTCLVRVLKLGPTATRMKMQQAVALDEKLTAGIDQHNERVIDMSGYDEDEISPQENVVDDDRSGSEKLADKLSGEPPEFGIDDLFRIIESEPKMAKDRGDELLDLANSINASDADRKKIDAAISKAVKASG